MLPTTMKSVSMLSLVVSIVGVTTTAYADDNTALQEIVVTAQKREQNLQDVGVSVSAIGAEGLAELGHQDISALVQQVPSLQVNQYATTVTVFNIRGVSQNDVTDAQEAPIAFYNDEVYVGALGAISGQNFDLQRVEVLRGPQGTLFGRNATGGLIQVVSAEPTSDFEGFVTMSGGSFNEVGAEAAVSGPLSDTVRGRLSFSSESHDGYIDNLIGPDPGSERFYALRAQIEADVGDGGKLRVKFEAMENNHEVSGAYTPIITEIDPATGGGTALPPNVNFWGHSIYYPFSPSCPGCDAFGYKPPNPNDPFVQELNHLGDFDRTWWNVMARYDQDVGFGTLTSISDFQMLHKRYNEDSDGTPNDLIDTYSRQDLYQISEEMRLAGKTDRMDWLGGIYLLNIHTTDEYANSGDQFGNVLEGLTPDAFGPGSPGNIFAAANYGGTQDTKSLAVFAQDEYKLDDQFSLTVGGRYSADWKTYDYSEQQFADPLGSSTPLIPAFVFNQTLYPNLASEFFGNYSGKVELDYKPDANTLIYASVNRGTKAGGFNVLQFGVFNPPFSAPPTFKNNAFFSPLNPNTIDYSQEVLTNFEGGFKLSLWDKRATFDASAFHYDYHNYQLYNEVNFAQFVTNRPAEINGIEAQASARPIANLTVNGFGSLLYQAEVHDVTLPNGVVFPDRHMPNAPRWSVGWSAIYDIPLAEMGDLSLSTDWKYDGWQWMTAFNVPIDHEPPRVVGNVRLTYDTPDSKWEAAFFVNNVTNKYYRVFQFDNTTNAGGVSDNVYAPPRWFGGSLTYHFGG